MLRRRLWLTVAGLAALAALAGCGQSRRDVYMHLMTPLQQQQFRQLESEHKPTSLKLAYLQGIGVYQQWSQTPKEVQDLILRREVQPGMTEAQVRMAWGPPDRVREAPDGEDFGQARIVWDYDKTSKSPERDDYRRSVGLRDGRVQWVYEN